jgi:hypothetical protein
MYGVIIEVRVNPSREQEARNIVRDMIVPRARTHRGFSTGYWLLALQGDAQISTDFRHRGERPRDGRTDPIRRPAPRRSSHFDIRRYVRSHC